MMKTLKGKISLVYIGLVLLIAFVGIVSALSTVFLRQSVDGLIAENYISISAMEDAGKALNAQNVALLDYMEAGDESGIAVFPRRIHCLSRPSEKKRRMSPRPMRNASSIRLNVITRNGRANTVCS